MLFVIRIILFHVFYHISYFLTFDVIVYHIKNKIPLYKTFNTDIIITFATHFFMMLLVPYLLDIMEIPLILDLFAYLIIGIVYTKDIWIFYEMKMKKYEDTYFSKYSKLDPFYIRKYCDSCEGTVIQKSYNKKIKEILKFMEKYPYKLIHKKTDKINCYANLENNTIVITNGSLNLPIGEIKAMLGHEIMHFKVDGKISIRKRKISFFITMYIVWLIFMGFGILLGNSFMMLQLFLILIVLIYSLYFVFYHLVKPERYLSQLSELRCDRAACELDGVLKEDMVTLLSRLKRMSKKNSNEKFYLKIIRRYFLYEEHPNISYRIKKIKKYRKWSIIDYIDLPIHLLKQLLIGKGWNDD